MLYKHMGHLVKDWQNMSKIDYKYSEMALKLAVFGVFFEPIWQPCLRLELGCKVCVGVALDPADGVVDAGGDQVVARPLQRVDLSAGVPLAPDLEG